MFHLTPLRKKKKKKKKKNYKSSSESIFTVTFACPSFSQAESNYQMIDFYLF